MLGIVSGNFISKILDSVVCCTHCIVLCALVSACVCVCVQKSISFSLVLQEPHTALPHLYKESCGEKKKLTEVLKRDGSERQRDGEGMCTGENQESDGGSEGSESKPVG